MESTTEHNSENDQLGFCCDGCKEVLIDSPIVLSCGDIFCKKCTTEMEEEKIQVDEKTMYKCKSCNQLFPNTPKECYYFGEFLKDFNITKKPNEELLQCSVCLELLWKPSVPNCGHWICFWCLEQTFAQKCPLCRQKITYRPKVCHKIHDFILKHFPENSQRENEGNISKFEKVKERKVDTRERTHEGLLTRVAPTILYNLGISNYSKYIWSTIGCDSCGVFPVIGEKIYCCMDCFEFYGFDLCEFCYKNHLSNPETKLVGLYEQAHDPKTHKFYCINASMILPLHTPLD